ncbi:protein of unknown function [Geodermatophilus nigrescens]|uniref:DUF4184 family protein n=1 Tax=Geodermatophilus nigrescens TaxID=1070870 RepID=A0A1M5MHM8_9ACTN|nr:protein of unknown function [Geodermatophilus nigrescens]
MAAVPFTGSHPAAVLPILRAGLPASALVAGSLAPDVPLYLPSTLGLRTHTPLAVVTTDVVLGALLWAVWHGLLARPALAWAPAGLAARLPGSAAPGLRRRLRAPVRVLAALAVGAATHVLWDEFTHPGRLGTELVPALGRTWAGAPGTAWAQDGSGLAGALLLAAWTGRWWRRTPPRAAPGTTQWWWAPWAVLALVAAAAGAARAAGAPDPRSAAVAAAFAGGGAASAAAVLLALAWSLWARRG